MTHVNHLAYGWISPVMAYTFSFLGSLLALMLAKRARGTTGGRRVRLLVLSAVVLGSTGIWLMHFIAMLGFDVPSSQVRYDLGITAVSLLLAIVIVGFGLLVVGLGRRLTVWRFLFGGPLTGLGVAAMHYMGMSAINVNGRIEYDRELFVTSVVIAVVAATVALWLAMVVQSAAVTIIAAAAMGLAVSSMHYTGMAAVQVWLSDTVMTLSGSTPFTLLVPISLLASVLIFGIFYAMAGMSISDEAVLARGLDAPEAAQQPTPWSTHAGQTPGYPAYRGLHSTPTRSRSGPPARLP